MDCYGPKMLSQKLECEPELAKIVLAQFGDVKLPDGSLRLSSREYERIISSPSGLNIKHENNSAPQGDGVRGQGDGQQSPIQSVGKKRKGRPRKTEGVSVADAAKRAAETDNVLHLYSLPSSVGEPNTEVSGAGQVFNRSISEPDENGRKGCETP